MTNLIRSNFQSHPFHLVSPSPWPINSSGTLLALTVSTVLWMHAFINAQYCLNVALIVLISSMSLWFRDIISEGKDKNNFYTYLLNHKDKANILNILFSKLNIVRVISSKEISCIIKDDKEHFKFISEQ